MFRTALVFLLTILTVRGEDCPGKTRLAQHRLRDDLMCGYDRTIRPTPDQNNSIRVNFRMIVNFFTYEPHTNTFTVESWLPMAWIDEHLKWNPNDYDKIDTVHLPMNQIWIPDVSLYTRTSQGGNPAIAGDGTCRVISNGTVGCVPPVSQASLCVADLTKYPFDIQTCTLRIGSWIHTGEELDLQLLEPPIHTSDLVPNGEWYLMDTSVARHPGKYEQHPNNTYPSVNFIFKLQRLSGAHTASIILPAIALIIISLSSLWIAPNKQERITLCCLNVVCQFLLLLNVAWMVPLHGRKIPLIILFGRDSLLLSTFGLVFSVYFKSLLERNKPAPSWISSTVSVLLGCRPGQYLLLSSDTEKEIALPKTFTGEEDTANIIESSPSNTKSQDWLIFGKILDRVFFAINCVIYFTMFIAFTP